MSQNEESRWIEAESLHPASNNTATDDDDDDDDEYLTEWGSNLFADPDPWETFDYEWDVRCWNNPTAFDNQGSTTETTTTTTTTTENEALEQLTPGMMKLTLSVQGHKAELGQTLHSTGLTLWRAAALLADWLVEQHNANNNNHNNSNTTTVTSHSHSHSGGFVQGRTVLELGAGLGVPGMVAHWLGATLTLLTDGDTHALANLRANVRRHTTTTQYHLYHRGVSEDRPCFSGAGHSRSPATSAIITCRQLVWGNEAQIRAVQEYLRSVDGNTSSSNITTTTDSDRFDVILGSDIIYVDHVVEPLLDTVKMLLKPTTGVFLLAFARRNVAMDFVLQMAQQRGFVWQAPVTPEGIYIFALPG